jgi:8-amino-7-oxononanoate synthase
MSKTPEWVLAALEERKRLALFRQTVVMEGAQVPSVKINHKDYLAFCSNDYLGLANHPAMVKAMHDSALKYGVGSGASHLVNGHNREHQCLEEELANWLGYDRVMLFSTGYMANLGVIAAFAGKDNGIVQDKLNHASLIDGAQLAGAKMRRYLHSDLNSAEKNLIKFTQDQMKSTLLATDGIFSMDGDRAPLAGLARMCQQHNALLMLDDAHGLACCGESGKGSMELEGLVASDVPLLIGTFGKAFGTSGAFVACSHDFADYLTQFSRPYIYTTAMSPAIVGATRASLSIVKSEEGQMLRQKLTDNIAYFRNAVSQLPIELLASETAIQPIMLGDSELAIGVSDALKQSGIWCTAIRPPTVPQGSARLRITLSAQHDFEQISRLVNSLSSAIATRN